MENPQHTKNRRILIVSNRLPVSVHSDESGLEFQPSSGGLATGLSSLHGQFETQWIGWPGVVAKERRKEVEERLMSEYQCLPVFLPTTLVQKYYEGYSNRSIWPMFHSFPAYAKFSSDEWEAYKKANMLFCSVIAETYRHGDILWIHDYHLMMLPSYLRQRLPDATMGFFLHIPFPHHEIFRLVPQRKEILESLLVLDLIGFHTDDYAQGFLGCVRRMLGYDNTFGQLFVGDRLVQVDAFPMGIDFEKYDSATTDPALKEEIASMREYARSRKRIFSVSRLDYTKGIPESLHAYREFLRAHPEWHHKLQYILVVVPSRERVERYASLKREVDELVGNINGEFSTLKWTPVLYIYRSLSFGELAGLYATADIALVTPLRDGMNLIAKEYLAVRNDCHGVLILSEMTGAARELLEAFIVNPNSQEEITKALERALIMPEDEQQRRNALMRERLRTHDVRKWVESFFARLQQVTNEAATLAEKFLDSKSKHQLLADYSQASQRLVILDYDGTLVPFTDTPPEAHPDDEILEMLEKLSTSERNIVTILSGRDRHTLDKWLDKLRLTLVGEHGAWVKWPQDTDWRPTIPLSENSWKKDIRPKMELFVERVAGSLLEEKDFALVWHFRLAEVHAASQAARELLDLMSSFSANMNIQVLPGNKTIEVRSGGIGKGMFFTRFLAPLNPSFILALGDDLTDEELFAALPETAYSIKAEPRMSKARFNLKSIQEVRSLLRELGEH